MIPLNNTPRKCTAGYKLSRLKEKINHLMYMNDIKLFGKNEKNGIFSQNIGMGFGIEKCDVLVMKSGE